MKNVLNNTTANLKVAKRVNIKSSHHKKKVLKLCEVTDVIL